MRFGTTKGKQKVQGSMEVRDSRGWERFAPCLPLPCCAHRFGPEKWFPLDGPGAQCHTTLTDGSPNETLVVWGEGLQHPEVLSTGCTWAGGSQSHPALIIILGPTGFLP